MIKVIHRKDILFIIPIEVIIIFEYFHRLNSDDYHLHKHDLYLFGVHKEIAFLFDRLEVKELVITLEGDKEKTEYGCDMGNL